VLSALGYFAGIGLIVFAPRPETPVTSIFSTPGTTLLYAGFMVLGLSQGLVEGVINPLITTLYSDQKTRGLNRLHAWWPGGMIIGGLTACAMNRLSISSWELKLCSILVPATIYLLLALLLRYPPTERVQSQVTTAQMWREALCPGFIALFLCMWLTAALELGPDQWFPSVMSALVPGLQGIVYLMYTAGLVFLLRTFGSGIAHRSPLRTLLTCSGLAGIGLYWLGSLEKGVSGPLSAFAAATVFGVGKSYLWPTMLGLTSQQFPRGGALTVCLMGGAGMASVAVILPLMGARIDHYGPGAALRMVALLGLVLVIAFAMLMRGRGINRSKQTGVPV
jgi:hypothetical protein